MNKQKYLLFILGVFLITGISFTVWFTSEINIYGGMTINLVARNEIPGESAFISAHTPTGREVIIPVEKNKASVIGFYKDASIIVSCGYDIEKITIEYHGSPINYTMNTQCKDGSKMFFIPSEVVGNTGFFKKFAALFQWLLSVRSIQEILIAVVFLVLVFGVWVLYRKIKKRAGQEPRNKKGNIINKCVVVLTGFVFWLLVLLLVCGIGLRIFGLFYSSKQAGGRDAGHNNTFTVLCLGDSFTYGIGAHSDKSYPKQLEGIISTNEKIPVRVINAGICAGNTTQMLEQIQILLEKDHPDAVVMLFGMANSWNYYGFSKKSTFLNNLRIYKLIVRIVQNLHYKRQGLDTQERVNEFAGRRLAAAWHSVIKNEKFDIRYNLGSYYLADRNWMAALSEFSCASMIQPINDSVRNALWTCLDKLDAIYYFNHEQKKLIQQTLVPETVQLIDSLISKYPHSGDLKIIRYRYYLVKGDTVTAQQEIFSGCKKYPRQDVFYWDLIRTLLPGQRLVFFKKNNYSLPEQEGFMKAKGFLFLMENKVADAQQCFEQALRFNKDEPLSEAGIDICNMINTSKNNVHPPLKTKNKMLGSLLPEIANKIYNTVYPHAAPALTYKEKLFFDMILSQVDAHNADKDSLFAVSATSAIFQYMEIKEWFHDDFFLIHKNKRTMNLGEQEVFGWIESDINTIVDICLKQDYPVICMNYPLIPPPSSEEISYWAAGAGEIWRQVAQKKSLPFINQDSLFTMYGPEKSELFEPAFTGSEHCNEKGYRLMAYNIYICMKQQGYFSKNNLKKGGNPR